MLDHHAKLTLHLSSRVPTCLGKSLSLRLLPWIPICASWKDRFSSLLWGGWFCVPSGWFSPQFNSCNVYITSFDVMMFSLRWVLFFLQVHFCCKSTLFEHDIWSSRKNGLMGFIFCKFTFVASLLYLIMIKWMFEKKIGLMDFYFFQVHFWCKSTLLDHDKMNVWEKIGLMDFIFFKFTFGASLLYLIMIKWMFEKKWIDVMRLPYLLLLFWGTSKISI